MQAQFVRAENNVKELSLSVDLMKNESRKLLERAGLAERDMKYGHSELLYDYALSISILLVGMDRSISYCCLLCV